MAARLNRLDTERVLQRIKLSQLANRLQDNALGKLKITVGDKKDQPYQMSDGQIKSAVWLLERHLARAESPKSVNVSGSLELAWPLPKSVLDL